MEDAQIIDLYFARNESAIAQTEKKYGAYCMQIALHILYHREDAEECVSDTWMKTWQAIPPERPKFLQGYLAKITRNLAINVYRARHTIKRGEGEAAAALDELAEIVPSDTSVEEEVVAGELRTLIDAFVRALPDREGNVFIRRYFFTESVTEIAKRYDLTAGNVSVILNRTRRKLKDALEAQGYTA